MGCVIIYYVTPSQIANLLRKSPVCESVRELVHESFHSPELVRDSYAFVLHEPMHLRAYVHASIAKRMSHELTREA